MNNNSDIKHTVHNVFWCKKLKIYRCGHYDINILMVAFIIIYYAIPIDV